MPVLATIATEHAFATRLTFNLSMIPTIQALFPTERVNVVVSDPAQAAINGTWLVESTEYTFSRQQTRSWTLNAEISIFRTNYEPKDCGGDIDLDIYHFNEEPQLEPTYTQKLIDESFSLQSKLENSSNMLHNLQEDVNESIDDVNGKLDSIRQTTQNIMESNTYNHSIYVQVDNIYNMLTNDIDNSLSKLQKDIKQFITSRKKITKYLLQQSNNFQNILKDEEPKLENPETFLPYMDDVIEPLRTANISFIINTVVEIQRLPTHIDKAKQIFETFRNDIHKIDNLGVEQEIKSSIFNNMKQKYLKQFQDIIDHITRLPHIKDSLPKILEDFAKEQLYSITSNTYKDIMENLL